MTLKFTADETGVETANNIVTAWLRAKGWTEQSLHGLMLMHWIVPDDDSNDVYLEIPIQRFIANGGIIRAVLKPSELNLELNENTARAFGGYRELSIQIETSASKLAELRDGLCTVFRDCDFYSECGFE